LVVGWFEEIIMSVRGPCGTVLVWREPGLWYYRNRVDCEAMWLIVLLKWIWSVCMRNVQTPSLFMCLKYIMRECGMICQRMSFVFLNEQ